MQVNKYFICGIQCKTGNWCQLKFLITKVSAQVYSPFMTDYPFPKASLKHRLAQLFLEYGLFIVTLGVGYIVWFWISLGNGQTPGKQVLKLRVYNATNGKPAQWGHMFIRELGLYFAIGIATLVPAFLLYPGALLTVFDLIYYVVILADILWIFKGGKRQRLVDVICKTDVLNEAAQVQLTNQLLSTLVILNSILQTPTVDFFIPQSNEL